MRFAILLGLLALAPLPSPSSVLLLQVSDLHDRPLQGVIVSTKSGSSTSPPTDIAGKTQIDFAQQLSPGQPVQLVLVRAPSANLRFFSPYRGDALVPMPNQALPVYLGQPGDRAALANAVVVDSLAAAIDHQIDADAHKPSQVKGIVPKLPKPSSLARAQVVANVSHEAELDPLQVDTAIRNLALGRKDRFNMDLPLFQKFATDYVAMLPDSTMVQYVQRGKMN